MSTGSSNLRYLRGCRDDPAFLATRSPYLVLDRDLRIVAANPAYCAATLRAPDELTERPMFEVFPDNPDLPGADGVVNLTSSFERVLRRGRRDAMRVQRYDVPGPTGTTGFVERVWVPVNSPLRCPDGHVIGLLHHVEDVTGVLDGAAPDDGTGAAVLARTLAAENAGLRARFDRHASIEQAKGVLMARRGCTADEAFALLRTLSHNSNTKLYAVADALLAELGR
ncbi:ANTAR domain-containing protein [Pseudonocardia sp. NPDC049635]|uniref:ANTAR domain-containing protein n=1 Tax=Pseudonocardia sp. NPDC049635 TaxID=3155506 RepID=UPI0033EDB364